LAAGCRLGLTMMRLRVSARVRVTFSGPGGNEAPHALQRLGTPLRHGWAAMLDKSNVLLLARGVPTVARRLTGLSPTVQRKSSSMICSNHMVVEGRRHLRAWQRTHQRLGAATRGAYAPPGRHVGNMRLPTTSDPVPVPVTAELPPCPVDREKSPGTPRIKGFPRPFLWRYRWDLNSGGTVLAR
jgi:hypothetical protein